ncbi:MAG: tRNA (adenine(22)-N(1))-methyltransferase TrmK [Calditrichota bacterium]
MHNALPGRFEALFRLVPPNVRCLTDIGYDHGKIMTRLVRVYKEMRTIGVEIQPEAADRFMRFEAPNLPNEQNRIDLRTGDGLHPVKPGEADALLIAGVGEMTTDRILSEGTDRLEQMSCMIFMPSHAVVHLRHTLKKHGWVTDKEIVAYERRRYYLAVRARKANENYLENWTWRYAPSLFDQKDPMLYYYLIQVKEHFRDRLQHVDKQPPAMRDYCLGLDEAIEKARKFAAEEGLK